MVLAPLQGQPRLVSLRRVGSTGLARIECASIRERQASLLGEQLSASAQGFCGRLAVDLGAVSDLSVSFLSVLVGLSDVCRDAGGALVIHSLPPDADRLLKRTGLDQRLTVVADEHAAAMILEPDQARASGLPHWQVRLARFLQTPVRLPERNKAA